jgi:hypothetical protein
MRTRRTKEQIRKDIYNKDVDAYNFYVVNLDTMKAETGFEFKEDAVDVLNDYDDKKKYKVVSKKSLKTLGIENPNESFKYAGGGNVKPFEYKENNSTIMINGTKADVKEMYLDYVNNFLSVSRFAEYYNISERQANSIIESGRKYAKEDGYYAGGGEFMTDPTFGNFQNNVYADGGVTQNYVSRRNLNTITIKKGNQKLTYKISDVLNGAYKLESGAKLEDIAFYVPKRSIVKVQLKNGKDFKPANGYWIKDGAKPIHVTKFDDGGHLNGINPYVDINSIRERYELLNDMYFNEDTNVEYSDILKVGDVVFGDGIDDYARIEKEINDPEKGDYFIFQDRYNNKFAFYVVESVRDLKIKSLFIQNVGISEEDFLYSPELINIYKDLNFAKGRVRLYEKNPNNASNYHGINYNDYSSASSQIKPLEENLRLMLQQERRKFNEGGVMSRLLTRKKDQPKVETINEEIDLNEDSRIRVRPSSFVRKDKEGDWMMKNNSSKEARSYAGGGSVENIVNKEADEFIKKLEAKGISAKKRVSKNGVFIYGEKNQQGKYKYETYLSYSEIPNKKFLEIEMLEFLRLNKKMYAGGGKTTFSEKAKAIAKNFEGKRVEPKYQKEYGKVYDSREAKEVGNKIAGSQKAKYDAKLEKGSEVKKKAGNPKMKATIDLAKKIRKDGEKWTDAVKRASLQLK